MCAPHHSGSTVDSVAYMQSPCQELSVSHYCDVNAVHTTLMHGTDCNHLGRSGCLIEVLGAIQCSCRGQLSRCCNAAHMQPSHGWLSHRAISGDAKPQTCSLKLLFDWPEPSSHRHNPSPLVLLCGGVLPHAAVVPRVSAYRQMGGNS